MFSLVSVIIPVYNVSLFIGEAILFVINQKDHDWEAITVDNCSTGDTFDMESSFADRDFWF